jgi:putative hydrolase of the HAD superfamily
MRPAAIFDLDDTLYDREQFVQSGFAAVAEEVARTCGIPADWALATLRHAHGDGRAGMELQALCADHGLSGDRLAGDTHAGDMIEAFVRVIREHRPSLVLAPGAAAVLTRLRSEGWSLAVLTNGLPATQRAKVEALAIEAMVDAVVYAEEHVPGGKPARAAFDAALEAIGAVPAHTVFIGDDLVRDVHGARAAQLRTIRMATDATARRVDGDADAVVSRLTEVPAVAAGLVKKAGAHAA